MRAPAGGVAPGWGCAGGRAAAPPADWPARQGGRALHRPARPATLARFLLGRAVSASQGGAGLREPGGLRAMRQQQRHRERGPVAGRGGSVCRPGGPGGC